MPGLIGKKIGMTSIFSEEGKNIPCTILEVGPCKVTQVKTEEIDGYNAIQLGFADQKESRVSKAALGHFKKADSTPLKKLIEFPADSDVELGDIMNVDIFEEGDFVTVTGTSKGKGFQGVVKRHILEELVMQLTDSTTDCVLQVLLVQLLIQQEYSKECVWLVKWVMKELKLKTYKY